MQEAGRFFPPDKGSWLVVNYVNTLLTGAEAEVSYRCFHGGGSSVFVDVCGFEEVPATPLAIRGATMQASEVLAGEPPVTVSSRTLSLSSKQNLPDGRPAAGPLDWIRHDIQHELATIRLLAEVIAASTDVGAESRRRLEQLGSEADWLTELISAYYEAQRRSGPDDWRPPADSVRVDRLVAEVLGALRMTSGSRVRFVGVPATVWTNRLTLWRSLRNLLDNAFRAAGQQVEVTVAMEADSVIVSVDDDGPGFGHGPKGIGSLGLGIVQDFAVANGGRVEIARSGLGGCCVRLVLPSLDELAGSLPDGPSREEPLHAPYGQAG